MNVRWLWLRRGLVGLAAAVALLSVTPGAPPAGCSPEPVRYRDRVFATADVTKDLVYRPAGFDGGTTPLELDVYEPHGDLASARPVVVWMHGYGAASSDKASPLDVEIITRFVFHGAVVVSFNYRVDGSQTDAQLGEDPNAAVAWVRAHAAEYRIDVDRIAFAGISAGAYRTMHAAYDGDIAAGEPAAESRVRAVLSFSGTGPTDTIQAGEPPLFMAHGKLDVNAPYANAVATCEAAKAAGVPCEFHAYADADHFGLFRYADELEVLASRWLYDALDLANAQNPPLPTTTTTTRPPTTSSTSTTTVSTDHNAPPPADPVDGAADYAG